MDQVGLYLPTSEHESTTEKGILSSPCADKIELHPPTTGQAACSRPLGAQAWSTTLRPTQGKQTTTNSNFTC